MCGYPAPLIRITNIRQLAIIITPIPERKTGAFTTKSNHIVGGSEYNV
jgi:hypothetical protein